LSIGDICDIFWEIAQEFGILVGGLRSFAYAQDMGWQV
jgi:hypothetical protein